MEESAIQIAPWKNLRYRLLYDQKLYDFMEHNVEWVVEYCCPYQFVLLCGGFCFRCSPCFEYSLATLRKWYSGI